MQIRLDFSQCIYEKGFRDTQEDSLYPLYNNLTTDNYFYIVCDGMGGHEHGEIASSTICEGMSQYILSHYDKSKEFTDEDFNHALDAAIEALDAKDTSNALNRMGTTLAFLCFHPGGCFVAHIGDSRIYHIRPAVLNPILYVSHDHSLVYELYEKGVISYDEMKSSAQRNIITRAIIAHDMNRVSADIKNITDIQAGDYFYLCSDGMFENMEDDKLLRIICEKRFNDEQRCRALLAASHYSRDNHSAFLLHVKSI